MKQGDFTMKLQDNGNKPGGLVNLVPSLCIALAVLISLIIVAVVVSATMNDAAYSHTPTTDATTFEEHTFASTGGSVNLTDYEKEMNSPMISIEDGTNLTANKDIKVRTCSDTGHGYMVENQAHSFERINDSQACGLIHFVFENGEKALEDAWVFFEPGDFVEVTYAELNGYRTLAPGCWSWDSFELTVTYYTEANAHVRAPSACYVGDDNLCTETLPDGIPFVGDLIGCSLQP